MGKYNLLDDGVTDRCFSITKLHLLHFENPIDLKNGKTLFPIIEVSITRDMRNDTKKLFLENFSSSKGRDLVFMYCVYDTIKVELLSGTIYFTFCIC